MFLKEFIEKSYFKKKSADDKKFIEKRSFWFYCIVFEFKDKDYCPIEIIKGLTDKVQFQYLIKLMGPQEGTYLYATQFHSLR